MARKPREPRKAPRKRGRPKKDPSCKVKAMPALERRPKVMKLRLQGYSPEEIAQKLLLRPSTVRSDLARMAQEAERESPSKLSQRQVHNQRLEMLWKAVQDAVDSGNPGAISVALKVLERQSKLMGLDVDPKATVTLLTPNSAQWDTILANPEPHKALGFSDEVVDVDAD